MTAASSYVDQLRLILGDVGVRSTSPPPVLNAALVRVDSTDIKIADRLVGSGTLRRAGYL